MNLVQESMRLLWAGEWSLWQTLGMALLMVMLAAWIYRGEVKRGTTGRLRWLLPSLRCLALVTIVLTLAGPVLQLKRDEGNRGKITVFLDSSESMDLRDKNYSPGRKILLAKEHGFIPEESNLIDYRFATASRKMENLSNLLRNAGEATSEDVMKTIREELSSVLKILGEQKDTENTRENSLLEELWFDLEGSEWRILLKEKNLFNKDPDQYSYLTSFETKRNIGDSYGRKIRAFLRPPEDGEYTFWLISDDSSILQIAQPGSTNFKKVSEVDSYTGYSWNESVGSEKIFLRKQNAYEIQIIHKEGGGEDFCAVGWTLPSGKEEKPINGRHFTAPLSSKDSPIELNLQTDIRQKFEGILRTSSAMESPTFDNLAIEAMEYSFLFMEKFDAYAQSLLNQNISALSEAMNTFEKFSRMERATLLLANPNNGILEEFRDTHIIEVRNLSENATDVLWDNYLETNKFDPKLTPQSPYTDLSQGILSSLRVEDQESEGNTSTTRAAAVLISDGGHNRENSPFETAKLLSVRNLPIYTVGLGSNQKPPDLALLQTMVPDSVYHEDRIRGIISIKDDLVPGSEYKILIKDPTGEKVWEKAMIGMESGIGQISFDFPAKEIVERQLADFPQSEKEAIRTVPLSFEVLVDPIENETETENNRQSFSIDASLRKNQLLILDSRPRWETRYLNNLFDRDERWQVSCVWGKPSSKDQKIPRGDEAGEFPTSRKELLKFDLIVFGEIPPEEFSPEEQTWIVDFVTQRAGGILFLDGPRQKLRLFQNKEQHPVTKLIPVSWRKGGPLRVSPTAYIRPEEENRLSALTMDPIEERNEEVWKHLPLPAWASPSESLPGSEVFLSVSINGVENNQSSKSHIPLLAGKLAGAGKCFYMGFDETWRWRYEVADLYHQRFWNQILAMIMERPFALNQEQLSMDVGGGSHDPGKAIPLRVRLRNSEGKAAEPPYPDVDGLIWKGDEVVATIPLKGMESTNGLFTGEVLGLDPDSYEFSVKAPAILDEMEFAEQKLSFEVRAGANKEKDFLTCNENLLAEMAELSGGSFFREENFHELRDALRPISSGRVIITEIILWQSFGWLIFVVSILALEMFLRKRAGML